MEITQDRECKTKTKCVECCFGRSCRNGSILISEKLIDTAIEQ